MTKKILTQKYLKECLDYNPNTGMFTWAISKGRRVIKGNVAGSFNSDGYIRVIINKKTYLAHRLAFLFMNGDIPKFVDHINHIRIDNRWVNLREADHKINGKNQTLHASNSSGFTGVIWSKNSSKWMAQIKVNNKQIHLGYFDSLINAVAGRIRANKKYGFHENHGMEK